MKGQWTREEAQRSYQEWYKQVDLEIIKQVGMSVDDLDDCDFRTWWSDGITPSQAAARAVRYSGGEEESEI